MHCERHQESGPGLQEEQVAHAASIICSAPFRAEQRQTPTQRTSELISRMQGEQKSIILKI